MNAGYTVQLWGRCWDEVGEYYGRIAEYENVPYIDVCEHIIAAGRYNRDVVILQNGKQLSLGAFALS